MQSGSSSFGGGASGAPRSRRGEPGAHGGREGGARRGGYLALLALAIPGIGATGAGGAAGEDPPASDEPASGARVERALGSMGTLLRLEVEAPSRSTALLASEAAVRALEAVEARLSTWRPDSELARLNRAPVGEAHALSEELAADLAAAQDGFELTGGAFDPSVGVLVEAYALRRGGRLPSAEELDTARAAIGLRHLDLQGRRATRLRADLVLEEGGFGKGVGLDAALVRLREEGATRALLDLGGQVAVLPTGTAHAVAVARPGARPEMALELALTDGSLATTGNDERGLVVAGQRLGHVLDPRTALPALDFGSLTVWAPDATRADMLATGLYVLGPDEALARAARSDALGVLVLEPVEREGAPALRARCDATLAALVRSTAPGLELEVIARAPAPAPPGALEHDARGAGSTGSRGRADDADDDSDLHERPFR